MSLQAENNVGYVYRLDSYRTFSIVTGIIMYPTTALVPAPEARFPSGESVGRLLLAVVLDRLDKPLRIVLSAEKYRAEPTPVRIALGKVPRHSERTGCGEEAICWRVVNSVRVAEVVGGLCWRRVFSRSAGWSRTALRTPEKPPETKWFLRGGLLITWVVAIAAAGVVVVMFGP